MKKKYMGIIAIIVLIIIGGGGYYFFSGQKSEKSPQDIIIFESGQGFGGGEGAQGYTHNPLE